MLSRPPRLYRARPSLQGRGGGGSLPERHASPGGYDWIRSARPARAASSGPGEEADQPGDGGDDRQGAEQAEAPEEQEEGQEGEDPQGDEDQLHRYPNGCDREQSREHSERIAP